MINIYKLDDPVDNTFAQASRLGTWFPLRSKPCIECERSNQKRIPPLIIEWEPGSDIIGDFTWPGFNEDIIVTQHARILLEDSFNGFRFEKVEMRQKPNLKNPSVKTTRKKPRIWLPYNGQPLWDFFVTSWCHIDLELSGLTIERQCSTCGRNIYVKSNVANAQITIDSSTWDRSDFFRIFEYPRWIYCTERVKDFIQDAKLTNIIFSLFGKIP